MSDDLSSEQLPETAEQPAERPGEPARGVRSAASACSLSVGGAFVCFVVVGGIATALHFATMVVLVEVAGASPVWASAAGFVVGAVVGYVLNRRFTFASRRRHREALPRYVVVALVGLGVNVAVLAGVLAVFDWFYLLAQIVATLVALFWNFAANRLWTFAGQTRS